MLSSVGKYINAALRYTFSYTPRGDEEPDFWDFKDDSHLQGRARKRRRVMQRLDSLTLPFGLLADDAIYTIGQYLDLKEVLPLAEALASSKDWKGHAQLFLRRRVGGYYVVDEARSRFYRIAMRHNCPNLVLRMSPLPLYTHPRVYPHAVPSDESIQVFNRWLDIVRRAAAGVGRVNYLIWSIGALAYMTKPTRKQWERIFWSAASRGHVNVLRWAKSELGFGDEYWRHYSMTLLQVIFGKGHINAFMFIYHQFESKNEIVRYLRRQGHRHYIDALQSGNMPFVRFIWDLLYESQHIERNPELSLKFIRAASFGANKSVFDYMTNKLWDSVVNTQQDAIRSLIVELTARERYQYSMHWLVVEMGYDELVPLRNSHDVFAILAEMVRWGRLNMALSWHFYFTSQLPNSPVPPLDLEEIVHKACASGSVRTLWVIERIWPQKLGQLLTDATVIRRCMLAACTNGHMSVTQFFRNDHDDMVTQVLYLAEFREDCRRSGPLHPDMETTFQEIEAAILAEREGEESHE